MRVWAALLIGCAAAACGSESASTDGAPAGEAADAAGLAADGSAVDACEIPTRLAAGRQARYPWLARGLQGRPTATWTEVDDDGTAAVLYAAEQGDATWSDPAVVALGKDLFVNWADHARHAVDGDGRVAVAWLRKVPGSPHSYHAWVRLREAGGQWLQPQRLHEDASATEHGFVSLAAAPGGGFVAVWLDGRAMIDDGPMQLRARRVLADGALGPESLLDQRVCECCNTSLRADRDGGFVVAYRDRSDEEVRDLGRLRLRLRGERELEPAEPLTAPEDGWVMPGCPVNGPAQARLGGTLATAWFTAEPKPRVRLAWGAGAQTLAEGPGVGGRVRLAARDRHLAAIWLQRDEDGRHAWHLQEFRLAAGTLMATGPPRPLAATDGSRMAGFPALVALPEEGWLAAWTTADATALRTLRVR